MTINKNHESKDGDAMADLDRPTDPRLDRLLNEALHPESIRGGIPADLNNKILAATDLVMAAQRDAVIGRITPRWWGLGAVAAVMLAAGAAFWLHPSPPAEPDWRSNNVSGLVAEIENLEGFAGANASLDGELAMITEKVDSATTDEDWARLNASIDHVNDQIKKQTGDSNTAEWN